ncbi:hypothetical protein NX869_30775, partial [Burkholderia thailandensis]|nr:hypothetical protein [Burkholderia thailandensis]
MYMEGGKREGRGREKRRLGRGGKGGGESGGRGEEEKRKENSKEREGGEERKGGEEKVMGEYAERGRKTAVGRQKRGGGIEAVVIDSGERFEGAYAAWVGRMGGHGACTQVLLGTPLLL